MKRRNEIRASSLFLLELILSILLFCLTSAICVQLFADSHIMSQDARILNHAVNECSRIGEIINASNGTQDFTDIVTEMYSETETTTETETLTTIQIYYNKDLTHCSAGDGAYVLTVKLTEAENMLTAEISMDETDPENPSGTAMDSPDPIYELTVKHYLQRGIGNEQR